MVSTSHRWYQARLTGGTQLSPDILHTATTGDWCPCQYPLLPIPPVLPAHSHYPTHGRSRCQAHLLRAAWQGRLRLPRFTTVLSFRKKCSSLVKWGSCFPGEKHSAQPLGYPQSLRDHCMSVFRARVLATPQGMEVGGVHLTHPLLFLLLILPARLECERGRFPLACYSYFLVLPELPRLHLPSRDVPTEVCSCSPATGINKLI